MALVKYVRCLTVLAAVTFAVPAATQEITASHLKAASNMVEVIHALDQFDIGLKLAAEGLKQELIQKDPDRAQLISDTVDEVLPSIEDERADLVREVVLVYARLFSEADLDSISAFYESAAGSRLMSDGPMAQRGAEHAADIWLNGAARKLAAAVEAKLNAP